MNWLRDLVGRIVLDLQRNLWSLLLYDAIFAGLSFFLLMPLLSWAVSFMASSSGRLSVGRVAALDVDFLSVSSRLATSGLVDAARAAGKEVHV